MRRGIALVTFNVPPLRAWTLKYDVLGPAALNSLKLYAQRHGYALFDQAPPLQGLHPCWGKLEALRIALEDHEWAIWADCDALVLQPEVPLEPFLKCARDLVAQWPEPWFEKTHLRPSLGWKLQPVNTGVFALRRSPWSFELLRSALAQALPESPRAAWNGIGDQEAIAKVLRSWGLDQVTYVHGLQSAPGGLRSLFCHFYGNHGAYLFPEDVCWKVAGWVSNKPHSPAVSMEALEAAHWCLIQNLSRDAPVERGGPERFGYDPRALSRTIDRLTWGGM